MRTQEKKSPEAFFFFTWFLAGLDISRGLIDLAKKENSASNVRFFEEDAQTFGNHLLDWREKFDKILCCTVLHWCFDKKSVLKNVFQCLKPGGKFLLEFGLHGQLMGEWSSYGETGDNWIRRHTKWGLYLQVKSLFCFILHEWLYSPFLNRKRWERLSNYSSLMNHHS